MRLCVHLLCGLLALVCVSSHRILLREAEARQLDRLESHYENATDLGPVDLPDNHDEQERMEEDSNGSDYLEETLLGRGAFGTVWLAEHVKTGRKYALKKEDSHSGVEMEFSILQTFCSGRVPFFMRFKELLKECPAWAEPTNKSVCLVLGLAAGGEVQKRQDSVDGQVLYSWLLQSLAGIAYFHEAGFVHRDIKPENLFLDHKDRILVGDVGLSGKLDEDGLITGERGTAYYMAPEIWKEKPYGKPVDIFALGVTFHKLCSGSLPWNGHSKESIGKNIMFEPPRKASFTKCADWPVDAMKLIKEMIKKRADKRPTALGLLESLPESGGTPDGVACKYLRRRCNGGRDDLLRSDAGDIGSRYSVPMEDETDSAPIVAPPRVENKPVAPPRVENNPVAPPRVENKPKKTKLPSASPTEGNKPPVGKPPLAPKVVAPPRRDPSARPLAPPPPAPARGPPSPLTPSLKPYGSGGDEEQVAEEKEYLPSYLREDVNPRDVLRDPVIQQWTRIDRDNSSPPSSPTPSKPASERGGSSPRVYAPPRKNASIAFVQSPPDSGVMKDKGAEDGHDDPVLEGEVSDSIAEDLKAHAEERFTQATDIEEEDPMMKTFTGFGSALLPPKPENPKAPSSFSEHTSRGPILLQTGSREESQGEDDAVLEGAVSDSIAEDVKAHAEDRWTQEGEDKDPLMQTFTGFGSQAPLLPAKAESTDGPPSASSFLQIHAAAPALLQSSQAHSKEEGGGEDDAVLEGEVSDSIAEDVKQHAEDRWTQEGEVEDPLMQTFTGFDFSSLSNGS